MFKVILLITAMIPIVAHAQKLSYEQRVDKVIAAFEKDLKPVVSKSCFHCHNKDHWPWYVFLPALKKEVKLAVKEFDMSGKFPYGGRDEIEDVLLSINEVIDFETMPPKAYKKFRPKRKIKKKQREEILDWIDTNLELLEE
ncbi:MAG: hypothetical protein HOE90_20170 [Bacteriovoracaceae bacterium]|nr:hypothetical protein [Bacteriovoracaceae bacterium]